MARRSGRIPWNAIRDDTETAAEPVAFTSVVDFQQAQLEAARAYRLDRQAGQPARIELFCETAGMVPQLAAVAEPFGVPCYSGSGCNSLPGKRGAAHRAAEGGHAAVHGRGDPDDVLGQPQQDERQLRVRVRPPGGRGAATRLQRQEVVEPQFHMGTA
ncbi:MULTISPECIES: hypothetical protein [Streptomyces]|uniref:Uncharacterized protein n=2 Tax=Streptomyces rimosus subsp. rimosus TaxID=132474 RepID=L8F101_STRR1|nr:MULTISPECIES: hypothetical protein [Streptomyces]MYT42257.1 hypothetical protein [Streptomyces sp. SID5471]KUJ29062.1 hypothetical protein ADK46_30475 [Streptomyces rimosus subsp. rimosus]QDA09134.1 hypothetical protein CTZ40_40785 [Streptomyces rimosus]QEV80413.1 hypothetical protein CP984_40740 [Streptomyces rimosus]QST78820.1 hypothetical protein SRIM_000255 [Streptomyces rimosus subsp. rimosus ATCC 10970]